MCVLQPLLGSEKTAALYSSGQIHEENLGSIQFSLDYDHDTSILTLDLIQASDLASPDSAGPAVPDPYVAVRLLPDATNQLQTRVHRNTRSPIIDERQLYAFTALLYSRSAPRGI